LCRNFTAARFALYRLPDHLLLKVFSVLEPTNQRAVRG
jgi:hypothetical protein